MKLTHSYKRDAIEGAFDVIVIGSGIGGLSVAAILAKEGQRVLVLERHYTAGGFTHIFKRKDYEWDVGVHYIGQVHKKKSYASTIFRYVTDDNLEWASMGEVYDKIIIGDKTYDFVAGKENLKAQLKSYFPGEEEAIDAYFIHISKALKASRSFFMEKAMPPILSAVAGSFLRRDYLKYSDITTKELLSGLTDNEELIGVLTGQYGDYGLPPAQSSFSMHAAVASHYFEGGAYPVGGSGRIAETVIPVIQEAGGQVFTNADVSEVLVRNNRAYGVRMADGKEILCDTIISDAGVHNTWTKLLPQEVRHKSGIDKIAAGIKPSASHLCLYVGFKHDTEETGLEKSNLWIYPDYDHDRTVENYLDNPEAPLPVVYISFPSAKDPDWNNRYPGKSTVELVTLAPYDWFEKWDGSGWKKRGEDYEALKEKYAQRLLEHLYKYVPQTKGKVDYYELSTPLSTKNFVNYQHGEIYGLEHSPERFREKFLKPKTPVKGFYLTGQDIVSCGVMGGLMGGVLSASAILKKNVMDKIMKEVNSWSAPSAVAP